MVWLLNVCLVGEAVSFPTEHHRETPANARQFPRFHLPCSRGETSYLESCRNRDQSLNDVSHEVFLRTPGRRCLCCFSRKSMSLSGILPRRKNRIQHAAPNHAPSRSCARVEQNALRGPRRKFLQA